MGVNYIPKADQLDTMNAKLDAINESLKKREDFVAAVAKMESATEAANKVANTVQNKLDKGEFKGDPGLDATVTKEAVVNALGYETVVCTQKEYDTITNLDESTIYIIVG